MPIDIGLEELQRRVQAAGASWTAGETAQSGHSALQAGSRLGYRPGPNDPSLAESERLARERASLPSAAASSASAPPAFDWRSAPGGNFVTPIRDQGGCGSCVAFGAVAVLESLVKISTHNTTTDVDLSEAQLFFCYGPTLGAGACPDGGWWPDAAFDSMAQGIVDEACFPYTSDNQPCNLCSNWQNRLTKITGWHKPTTQGDMKAFLSTVGPMSACFTVYEDFYYHYTSGVYTYVSGNVVGGHCICIVGYDDTQSCWIAKNQWGSSWGESGYFRIGYGQCGIDDAMWAAEGVVTTAISPWPLVRKGANGHPVRTLQDLLRARSHPVSVDGAFGPATETAVKAFQTQKHLTADGVVGPLTWAALVVTVKQGSTGDAVRGVQEEFKYRDLSGHPNHSVDGIFGPKTDAAVRGFQTAVGLTVDGIVGPLTWQALVSGMLAG